MSEAEAREWYRLVRAAVRECMETWQIEARAGTVTPDALDTIVHRGAVLLMSRFDGKAPEVVVALLPNLLRVMLAAFVEMMAEAGPTRER